LNNTIKNILRFLGFLLLGILFIWLSLKDLTKVQIHDIFNSFNQANYNWILLSFVIALISHFIRALRWRMLLEPLGYKPRLINVNFAVLIGYFANLALPRLGEVTRCGTLTKYEKVSFTQSFGTVITERAFDVITFFILFFINLLIQYDKIHTYYYTKIYVPIAEKYSNINLQFYFILSFILVAVLVLLFIFIFRKRISHLHIYIKIKSLILNFWNGIISITKVKHPLLFILYSILIWGGYYMSTYVCFFCFTFTSSLGFGAAFVVLVFGAIGVMITPGGIGAFTFIVAGVLLNIYPNNVNAIEANAFGWMCWSAQTVIVILAGTVSLLVISGYNKRYIPVSTN
jgi:glycosyltransferase 2 family protein